jgi:transcription antitermination factor NusG
VEHVQRYSKHSPSWLVATTHARKENVAQEHLAAQGFRTFVPRFRRRRPGRLEAELAPLFPGYVFVLLATGMLWQPINSTRGVRRLLGSRVGCPLTMPSQAMDLLQARCVAGVVTRLVEDLCAGDRVKFISGPLADQIATVEGLDDQGRVRVLLDLLGIINSVSVDPTILAPVSA